MPCTACRRSLGDQVPKTGIAIRCDANLCTADSPGAQLLFLQLRQAIAAAAAKLQIALPDGWLDDPGSFTSGDAQFALRIARAAPQEAGSFLADLLESAAFDPTHLHSFLTDNLPAAIKAFFSVSKGAPVAPTVPAVSQTAGFPSATVLSITGGLLVVGLLVAVGLRSG
jgi:hypothetical protein